MTAHVGDYALLEVLGEGAFGKVRHAVHDITRQHYAVKIMDKSLIRHHRLTVNVRREIAIMKALQHPHIVSLHGVLSSETKLYVVLELVRGPELFELIANTPRGLPEPSARRYFQQLVEGVLYCHRRGVTHRDLKPENLLIDRQSGKLKITDFGLSSMKGADTTSELLTTQCGTPHYIAPEIISRAIPAYDGRKVDAWACGIILFALLAGYLPFDETDLVCLFDAIRHGQFQFPPWLSSGAKDLIWRLLCVDPEARASLNQVVTHPWFAVDFEPSDPSFTFTFCSPKAGRISSQRRPKRNQKRPMNRSKARKRDIPEPPRLTLELLDLKLPDPSQTRLAGPSHVSAAAAVTARNEMMKSGRSMSFSTRYTLIRKGIVTYGGVSLPHEDGNTCHSLGGIEQARMRGVISTTGSAFHASLATISESKDRLPLSNAPSSIRSDRETSEETDQTMHVIRSLRTTISMTRSASKWYEYSRNLASPTEEALLQKSTLISLKRLRNHLKELGAHLERNESQNSPFMKTVMSASQRREMLRLLDVWEIRIIRDAMPLSKNRARSTGLSGDELQAFQSLLLTWETQLAGEEIIEDVLIPGSELVEDEVPTSDIPDRFIQQQNCLKAIPNPYAQNETKYGSKPQHPPMKHQSAADGRCVMLDLQTNQPFDQFASSSAAEPALEIPSEAICTDLNQLWNQVLVANTSKLEKALESDSDSISSLTEPVTNSRKSSSLAKSMSVSPVTEWRSSDGSKHDVMHQSGNTPDAFQAEHDSIDQSDKCVVNVNICGRKREESGSSGIRHHSRDTPSRNSCSLIAESACSPNLKSSTASVDAYIESKSRPSCVVSRIENIVDEQSSTSLRSSTGPREVSATQKRRSRQLLPKRQNKSDLGHRQLSSSRFSDYRGTSEHPSQCSKDHDMSSVSGASLDDVEPRLVRSFGQRRIQTDLTPDLPRLEVLDTQSGFTALKQRIHRKGWRQGNRGNLANGLARETTDGQVRSSDSRYAGRANHGLLARLFGAARYDARFESAYNARTCILELSNTMKERGFSVAKKPGENKLRVALAGVDGRFVTLSFDFATKGRGCVVRFRKTGGEKHSSRHLEENLVWGFYDEILEAFRRSNSGVAVIDKLVG
ncbi:Serine/threonine protein kinase [Gracilaria domingensis]|nr:Serine/threonine protein kinase [Gracilaria domingensis]